MLDHLSDCFNSIQGTDCDHRLNKSLQASVSAQYLTRERERERESCEINWMQHNWIQFSNEDSSDLFDS